MKINVYFNSQGRNMKVQKCRKFWLGLAMLGLVRLPLRIITNCVVMAAGGVAGLVLVALGIVVAFLIGSLVWMGITGLATL